MKMIIETKHLTQAYVNNIPLVADDERFFYVPGASDYALSTYARLYKKLSEGKWKRQEMIYNRGDSYKIIYDYEDGEKLTSVESLIRQVFFPACKAFKVYNYNFNPSDELRWDIKQLSAVSYEDYLYLIQCKANNKNPHLEKKNPLIKFIQSYPSRKRITSMANGMRTRACNKKFKARFPEYQNTIIYHEWIENINRAKEYIASCWYYYPGKLVMDKDLMTFGLGNCYAPEFAVPLPYKYNNIFCKTKSELGFGIKEKYRSNGRKYYLLPGSTVGETKDISCNSYKEALEIGRKRKAAYVRKYIKEEQENGYLPEYILQQMERWAKKCEAGELIVWEPRPEVLERMGVLS